MWGLESLLLQQIDNGSDDQEDTFHVSILFELFREGSKGPRLNSYESVVGLCGLLGEFCVMLGKLMQEGEMQ